MLRSNLAVALLLAAPLLIAQPLAAASKAAPPKPAPSRSYGTWQNPSGSVRVAAKPCGQAMCGVVIWANAKAKADAAKGGSPDLVGMNLFENFTRVDADHWKGKVFVPDINKRFSGTVTVIDANTLKGEGCLLGGIGCKSQTWTRVK